MKRLKREIFYQMGKPEEFKEIIGEIAKYGIDSGFTGFTYTQDCVNFFDNNRAEILKFLKEVFADNISECIADSRFCYATVKEILEALCKNTGEEIDHIKNCAVWLAVEEFAKLKGE